MSKFLAERCRLIEEWKQKEKDHLAEKQKTMRQLGELLNLHNREMAKEETNECESVEDENQLNESHRLLQRIREKQDGR